MSTDNFDKPDLLQRLELIESNLASIMRRNTSLAQLSNASDEIGDLDIRAKSDLGDVRMIMSAVNLLEEFGVSAHFAGFAPDGSPTIWIDADTGVVNLTQVNFNGSTLLESLVQLRQAGWIIQQTATVGSEVRVLRMGMEENGASADGVIQYYEPGPALTIPNGDFASLDLTGWTEAQKGKAEIALGDLGASFSVRSLAVIGTDLYAGLYTGSTTSSVWKWDGTSWAALGTLDIAFDVFSLAVIGTDLYAGIFDDATTSSVWKWDGTSWAALGTLSTSFSVFSLAVIGTNLYAGLYTGSTTSSVWKWNGTTWAALGTLSTSFRVRSLAVIGTDLYAGLTDATTSSVWKWNGATWAALGTLSTSFSVHSLAVIGTDLYAGLYTGSATSSVWKWNGATWAALGTLSTSFSVRSLAVIDTDLYAGLTDATTSSIWKWNGATWVAFGNLSTSFSVWALAIIGTDLYAGLSADATTSSVWTWEATDWDAALGYAAIQSASGVIPKITSAARFAVTAGLSYSFAARSFGSALSGLLTTQVSVEFYTAITGGSLVSTVIIGSRAGSMLGWGDISNIVVVPATATHAIFTATAASSGGSFSAGFDGFAGAEVANSSALIFRDDGLYYASASGGEVQLGSAASYIQVCDEKTLGTAGGTFVSGAQRTRTLNTIKNNAGGFAALASNQITLQAGTYRVRISAPAFGVNYHRAFLNNITDGTTTLIGTTEFASTAYQQQTRSWITGEFTITSAKIFEVQHRCGFTANTYGFGLSSSWDVEVYTIFEAWRS